MVEDPVLLALDELEQIASGHDADDRAVLVDDRVGAVPTAEYGLLGFGDVVSARTDRTGRAHDLAHGGRVRASTS